MKQALELEHKVAIKWLHENKMIVNPDRVPAIVLDRRRSNNKFIVGSHQIRAVPSVDIIGITIDDKL